MPLRNGSSKKIVGQNIREFHTGKTYAHTEAKFGKKKADAQAVAVALSTARKYAKKAGGGKTDRYAGARRSNNIEDRRDEADINHWNDSLYWQPTTHFDGYFPTRQDGIVPSNHLAEQLGSADLEREAWNKASGFAEGGEANWEGADEEAQQNLAAQGSQSEPRKSWIPSTDQLSKWWYGEQPEKSIENEADLTADPVSRAIQGVGRAFTAPGRALKGEIPQEEMIPEATNMAGLITGGSYINPVKEGLGAGAGKLSHFTAKGAEKVEDIHANVMDASGWHAEDHPYGNKMAKELKTYYPKDIAASAYYLGISPKEVENLTTYMSPGAKDAFEKHYTKLLKSVEKAGPEKIAIGEPPIPPESEPVPIKFKTPSHEDEFVSTEPSMGPEWSPGPEDMRDVYTTVKAPKSNYPELPNHWVPNEKFDSHVRSLIQKDLQPIDWQKFNPIKYTYQQTQAMPPIDLKNISPQTLQLLGGRHDLPLWKGGNLGEGKYPAEIPHPAEEMVTPNLGGAPKHKFEKAFFTADNRHVAGMYGGTSPYVALTKKPVLQADYTDLAEKFGRSKGFVKAASYDPMMVKYIIDAAREQGADMVIMHNMMDLGGPQSQYAVLNPHILRAPHANFDPSKLHLRMPLAGLAGAGIYTYMAGQDEANAAEGKKTGGGVKKHPQIDDNPQDHEFIDFSRGGLIDSHIPGRTDKIPMRVRPGSYVLPADIPSALGEGNSKAGAEILKKMFTHGAYGLPPPHIHNREFRYPHMMRHKAEGGKTDHVPIVAAGGEFVVHPDVVEHLGNGSMTKGHKMLDQFVLHTRREHIKTLRKLKPPK